MPVAIEKNAPRTSRLDRVTAMHLAATEYERYAEALSELTPEDWHKQTACPAWDVRAMAGHSLGMAQFAASVIEGVRQQVSATRTAKAKGCLLIDALTDLQVKKNQRLTTEELIAAFRKVGPKAVAGRRRVPGFVRSRSTTDHSSGRVERWTLGYALDTIFTRDPWLHRSDIALATGRRMTLTQDHDGVLVHDVVTEWADRHGLAFDLTLTGDAGGHWSRGDDGPSIELDAVEFCRVLSGRGEGHGLLATRVPF